MAKLGFNTKCPCGETVAGQIKKPTWFENSFTKVSCKCGTRFLMACVRDKSAPRGERVFETHIELLELSDEAKQIQSSKFKFKAKTVAAKIMGKSVASRDTTVVITSLDENEAG